MSLKKEKKELWQLCEESMLRKLGLSCNFPRNVMCIAKDMLGIGLFCLKQ